MIYTSINNPIIKEIKKLQTKKYRDQQGLFLIEGEHLIKEATNLEKIIVLDSYEYKTDIETLVVNEKIMKYISNLDTSPEIMGICRKNSDNKIGNKVIVLDNIQDPGNLGTIIRSAVAFNFDTILLSQDTVDIYNPKVVRASQGMIFKLNIITTDLLSKLPELKQQNYHIIGTDVNEGNSIQEVAKDEKTCIIMGNEGNGMSEPIKQLCDEFINIEMNDNCESLNVGVAASIIMYEMR